MKRKNKIRAHFTSCINRNSIRPATIESPRDISFYFLSFNSLAKAAAIFFVPKYCFRNVPTFPGIFRISFKITYQLHFCEIVCGLEGRGSDNFQIQTPQTSRSQNKRSQILKTKVSLPTYSKHIIVSNINR